MSYCTKKPTQQTLADRLGGGERSLTTWAQPVSQQLIATSLGENYLTSKYHIFQL